MLGFTDVAEQAHGDWPALLGQRRVLVADCREQVPAEGLSALIVWPSGAQLSAEPASVLKDALRRSDGGNVYLVTTLGESGLCILEFGPQLERSAGVELQPTVNDEIDKHVHRAVLNLYLGGGRQVDPIGWSIAAREQCRSLATHLPLGIAVRSVMPNVGELRLEANGPSARAPRPLGRFAVLVAAVLSALVLLSEGAVYARSSQRTRDAEQLAREAATVHLSAGADGLLTMERAYAFAGDRKSVV